MNKAILIGRITKDPEVRYSADNLAIGRYTLAIDRIKEGTDFINCIAFGKSAEFAEKYFSKGMKIAVEGRIQTGSYEKDGVKHYTTDVVVERQEFCESKKSDDTKSGDRDLSADEFKKMFPPESISEEIPFE